MSHMPKRSSVFGVRKLVPNDRQASRKAVGNQNLTPGRYDIDEEVTQATQKSLDNASKKKATPVEINPVVQNTVAQTYN